ncbi:MAG: MtrB/PioB family decaheme-associated outer membrane protein [Steroidobacteraceae bacterium]|jgi:MtrB/PioB family decaheme-associated outer membrane protein
MKRHKPALLRPLGLTVAASLVAGGAVAAEPEVDTSNWKCEQCPFYTGYEAEVEVGAFGAGGANDSYGRYTGIDSGHVYVDAAASGALQKADGTYVKYDLQNLGLASRDGIIEAGQDGRYGIALSYDGQPNRLYDDTVTPFRGVGSGTLTLPTGWVHAGSTAAMTDLDSSLSRFDLGYDWRTVTLSGHYLLGSAWTFYSNLSHQEKEGTDLIGASFLTQAVELAQPIDYVTTDFEAGVRWSSERASLRVEYSGSWFDDDTDSLSFANPYPPIVPGSTSGQLALPPSNDLQRFAASGDIHFPFLATTLTFAASVGRLNQNEGFLPLSTLPATPALGIGSLDGDLRLTHYSLGLSSRPLSRLYLRGTASYDGRDDQTPVITVPSYIVTDTFPGGAATALRYGQDRSRAEGNADFTATRWLRLGVGGKYQEVHYAPGQVVNWTQDGQGWGRAIVTPLTGVTLTLKGGGDTRKASSFNVQALPVLENPQILEYDIAPRDQRFYSLTGAWAITPALTWSLEGFIANDDYPLSTLGLQSAHERRFASTLTWAPHERLSLYVDGGYQTLDFAQNGFTGAFTAPWVVTNNERFWSTSAGLHLLLRARWDLNVDYTHAPSYADTDTLVGGLAQAFPENTTTLDSVRFDLRYRWTNALSVHLRYAYERYDSSDWALAGVGPATLPNFLSVGRNPYSHDVNLIGLTVRYSFESPHAPPASSE